MMIQNCAAENAQQIKLLWTKYLRTVVTAVLVYVGGHR